MKISPVLLLPILLLGLPRTAVAQQPGVGTVSGRITDTLGQALPGASIKLTSARDTMAVSSGPNGNFIFRDVKAAQFQLSISSVGFQGIKRRYSVAGTGFTRLDVIQLKMSSTTLQGVTVTAVNPISIREDTTEYKASAYKVREGSAVEEILRKLPGVSVDKDGNITAHGKQVTKVRVNGKDFFSGDVQTATKNLPAEIVDKLQVIDDYGDQANITGIKSGDPDKVLNIELKKNRNRGYMLNTVAGIGNDGRYEGNLSYFQFRDKRQISVIGTLNNLNQNSFRFGSGSNGQNANGITTTQSIGMNYRDDWSKKMTVYGNYSFSDQQTNIGSRSLSQTVFQSGTRTYNSSSQTASTVVNHRFSFNMEYKPDTLNYLKITPSFSYSVNSSSTSGISEITESDTAQNALSKNSSHSNASSPNGGINVLYNHRFHKKGRNLSINAGINASANPQSKHIDNSTTTDSLGQKRNSRQFQQVTNTNRSTGENIRISYTEPLVPKNYVEFNYALNNSANHNMQNTFDIDPTTLLQHFVDSLSNAYKYQFSTQRAGINYRFIGKKLNFYLGFVTQYSLLSGEAITRNLSTRHQGYNVFPAARFYYEFKKGKSFTARYNGSSNQPGYDQLQPVTDRSSPFQPVRGNPNLLAEVSNSLSLRYNQFEFKSGNVLFANADFTQTQHKIVSSTVKRGDTLYTTYRNANGFFAVNGYLNYSKPFDNRKFTASLLGNVSYSNNISFIDAQQNYGKNWVFSPTAKFRIDLDTLMDTELSASYTLNTTRYSIPSPFNTDARTWVLGLYGRNYFFKDWILGYDLSKTLNSGYSSTLRANPTLLNLYLERQFLKKNMAALRFEAFDIFNQNTGVSRSVSANSITDSQVTRLARYFLLTFTLKLQQFPGGMPPPQDRGGMRRFGPGGPGGMSGPGGGRMRMND